MTWPSEKAYFAELMLRLERLERAVRLVLSWKLANDVRKELEAALRNGKP